MEGIVDIHTHIIPGLDDGSQSMETSVFMVELAAESGVEQLIATPHANQRGVFENYASHRLYDRFNELRETVKYEGIPLEMYLGMEVFGTEEVPQLLREKKLLTLNNSRYLLIEFDFFSDVEWMESILFRIMDMGYIPVVAHPERYYQVQLRPESVFRWTQNGIAIQLNKGSFFGKFGREPYMLAHDFVSEGVASCIASDAHGANLRTTDMTDIDGYISYTFSDGAAELLLAENPKRILKDKPLLRKPENDFF